MANITSSVIWRRASRSLARSRYRSTRTGAPKLMTTGRNGVGNWASGGMTSRAPRMPTGTMGAPVRRARRAGPVWPLYSTPSRLRVPSG
jgi:hypothetical protein